VASSPRAGHSDRWRYYVLIAGVEELKPLPFAQWNWAKIAAILASAGEVITADGDEV
jgi:hypothetical protein